MKKDEENSMEKHEKGDKKEKTSDGKKKLENKNKEQVKGKDELWAKTFTNNMISLPDIHISLHQIFPSLSLSLSRAVSLEFSGIQSTNQFSLLHLLNQSCYVEVLKSKTTECLTDLPANTAMFFINHFSTLCSTHRNTWNPGNHLSLKWMLEIPNYQFSHFYLLRHHSNQ